MTHIRELFKQNGLRYTTQKKSVIQALQHTPQTVREIFEAINVGKQKPDKATVYRILSGLMKLGIVKEVLFSAREKRYELATESHHHHLICELCGVISDVAICEDLLLKEVQNKTSFKIRSHSLEFFGVCNSCQ